MTKASDSCFMSMRRLVLICFPLLAVCAIGAPIYLAVQDRRDVARRLHQAKDILVASKLYAQDHGGRMPMALNDLSTLSSRTDGHRYYEPIGTSGSFLDRASKELEITSQGILAAADPRTIFLRETKTDGRGRRVVGYLDASATIVDDR